MICFDKSLKLKEKKLQLALFLSARILHPYLYFELGKAKAVKGEGWAPPFVSCAQDTMGLYIFLWFPSYSSITPTAPTAIRLWEFLPVFTNDVFFFRKWA